MTVQEAYNEWSSTYDSDGNATRDLDRTVLARVLGDSRFESIIEAGCGTGKNSELLSRLGGTVMALDFSAGMLAQAKAKLAQRPGVTFSLTDVTQRWPCADQSANLVTCNLILEHMAHLSPVFSEAARALVKSGWFFVCELHPFRQYQGTLANFRRGKQTIQIPGFVHHISDFLETAERYGFSLKSLQEWWHEKDTGKPPRLVSLLFERSA